MGFTVLHWESDEWYALTASHCTNSADTVGGVLGWRAYQPSIFVDSNESIGVEAIDPPLFTDAEDDACPEGHKCRYSDAALIAYDTTDFSAGDVAWPNLTSDSLTWGKNGNTVFSMTKEIAGAADPWQNMDVYKVGRTSGRTKGFVTATCADIDDFAGGHTILCTSIASYWGTGGDSGGPVVANHDVIPSLGVAIGIHIGSTEPGSLINETYFSSTSMWIQEMEADFGGTFCIPNAC